LFPQGTDHTRTTEAFVKQFLGYETGVQTHIQMQANIDPANDATVHMHCMKDTRRERMFLNVFNLINVRNFWSILSALLQAK